MADPVKNVPHYRRIHRKPGFVGLEDYGTTEPGFCVCGDTLAHHGPAAIGRPCDRGGCGCNGFVSAIGVQPSIVWHSVGWDREWEA